MGAGAVGQDDAAGQPSLPERRRPDPDELYHYKPLRSAEMMGWLGRTILDNQIYFSSPASFNDPFDSRVWPSFDGTPEQKRTYIEGLLRLKHGSLETGAAREELTAALADPDFLEKGYRSFQEQSIPTLGVLCLSERPDDILMWSHYADAHRGVSLILAGCALFPDLAVEPVSYPMNNKYPDVNFFIDSYQKQADAVLLTKAQHWEYEREWRVIDTKGPGWHSIDPEWLLGLVFGCSTPMAQIAEITRMALQRRPPLRLFRAEKKAREFALAINAA